MGKKYKLTNETKTIVVDGKEIVLHRIFSLKNIRPRFTDSAGNLIEDPIYMVPKGFHGGYIESEENLSQEGNAWVDTYGYVYGNARVLDDATVSGLSEVGGNAVICGDTFVGFRAKLTSGVYKDVDVYGSKVIERGKNFTVIKPNVDNSDFDF